MYTALLVDHMPITVDASFELDEEEATCMIEEEQQLLHQQGIGEGAYHFRHPRQLCGDDGKSEGGG
jgi:hypothetical protein